MRFAAEMGPDHDLLSGSAEADCADNEADVFSAVFGSGAGIEKVATATMVAAKTSIAGAVKVLCFIVLTGGCCVASVSLKPEFKTLPALCNLKRRFLMGAVSITKTLL